MLVLLSHKMPVIADERLLTVSSYLGDHQKSGEIVPAGRIETYETDISWTLIYFDSRSALRPADDQHVSPNEEKEYLKNYTVHCSCASYPRSYMA
jgi:hypothetical protein